MLTNNKHPNRHLQGAWNKYGSEAFGFEIVEHVYTEDALLIREQYYIDEYSPEYNLAPIAGRQTGVKFTQEACDKIAASHVRTPRQPPSRLGIKLTPEQIEQREATRKARWEAGMYQNNRKPLSDEHKAKISAAGKGRKMRPESIAKRVAKIKGRPSPIKGRPFTEEHKQKLREAALRRYGKL